MRFDMPSSLKSNWANAVIVIVIVIRLPNTQSIILTMVIRIEMIPTNKKAHSGHL